MKKSLLTLTLGLLASTSVFAADVANPFYQPQKHKFLSDTTALYQNVANGAAEHLYLAETLTFGVTRKFAVTGTLADAYNLHGRMKKQVNWDNPAWSLGVKYNLIDCDKTDLKVQVGANYTQGATKLAAPYATAAAFDHHSKAFSGYAKIGYAVSEGFTPYVSGSITKPVGKYESEPYYIGRAGAYTTLTDAISVDAGLNYYWNSATDIPGKHAKILGLDGAMYYKLSDVVSLGVTGSYIVDSEPEERDFYAVGLNLKAAF